MTNSGPILTAISQHMSDIAQIEDVQVDTRHFIGNERVASTDRFEVFSPIDGAPLAKMSSASENEVDHAVGAANKAFPIWKALGADGRADILVRFAAGLRARINDLATVETTDNGSLLIGNQKNVMARCAHNIEFFANFARTFRHPPIKGEVVDNHVDYQPCGVAALITPWNAPLMLSTWKVGPALAAGNTAVLKPPEWAPLTCSLLADIALEAALPAGVLNVVQGLGSTTGAHLVAHENINRISFTGSPATARHIGASAARSLTPVSFELGGKSPFIIFGDADLDAAARTVAHQYINAGQVCLAGTRILVEASVADVLLEKIRAATEKLPVGDPRNLDTRVGPLIHRRQHERVAGFVDRAIAGGAKPIFGASAHECGPLYYQPTLLGDVCVEDEVFQEEVFGPVLTWNTFETEEQALQLANATRYGLAAMIYTRNRERARRIAADVTAGTVWVNCFFVRDLEAPFGGTGISGIGREGGQWSFDFFCDIKNVAIRHGSLGESIDG